MKRYFILLLAALMTISVMKAQSGAQVAVCGTVYISSSRSQGVLNGKTFNEGEGRFRNQPIYFSNDTTLTQSSTDTAGVFHVMLKPGSYNIYQEPYIKGQSRGLISFGSSHITVTRKDETFVIRLHNHVSGRSTMGEKGIPGTNKKSTTPVKATKNN